MRKLYKANNGGSVAVLVDKPMIAAGFVPGVLVAWEAQPNGFLLRLATLEPKVIAKPISPLETL
jgi:hypothetical protein